MTKFLRRTWHKYSKLGKGRKKKQVWRRPTGRDNKMREKRKGYPVVVSVGYKKNKQEIGKINGKMPVIIMNAKDLEKIRKNELGVIGNIGKKKKLEIAKIAKDKKIEIYNMNAKNYLKKTKVPQKKKVEVKKDKKKTKKTNEEKK